MMKMVGAVLCWRSSSSGGLIWNRNLVCRRAFSAATPAPEEPSRLNKSKQSKWGLGSMAEVEGSENWKTFKSWMLEFNKRYESEEEMLYRFGIFNHTLAVIEKANKESSGCTFGLNQFSDLNHYEFSTGFLPSSWHRD